MDKKLLSVLIFGIFAISLANILLSIGIVSLLLVGGSSGGGQPSGSAVDTMPLAMANGTTPVSGMGDPLQINGAGTLNDSLNSTTASGLPPSGNASTAKPASAAAPFDAGQMPSGSMQPPSGGQIPSGGQMPSGGQIPAGASGQMPSGATTAGTGAVPGSTGTGQAATTSGQYPAATGQMTGDELISSLLQQSGMQGISVGSTPVATASPGTTSWVFNGSVPFGSK